MIKIAVTGPHCCGKSTVLKKVEEFFKENNRIKIVKFSGEKSPVDYSNATYLKSNRNKELDISFWMILKMIERELHIQYNKEDDTDIFVLDRCIVDQIVYPAVLLNKKDFNSIKKIIELWIDTHQYNVIFYLPKNEELLKKYGRKDKSIEYLEEIEKQYLKVLDELKCKYFVLPTNQNDQIKFIIEYLKNIL